MQKLNFQVLVTAAISMLPGAFAAKASDLRLETLKAWNEYIQAEDSRIVQRAHSGQFLWSDESADRLQRVRNGEIVIAPVGPHVPKGVPHGLIHHWEGAVFVPGARLDDIFAVVRDYGRYKEFYAPNVLESKTLREGSANDEFSMLMLNKALFAKIAMDTDFQGSYVRVGQNRWYSIAYSTRVQEIQNYGQSDQRELAPNTGDGYIWRLYSLSRFEERDGGVYVELEAVALSRDVPISLRWLVDPIVRRVSKGSLLVSLQKTEQAVHSTSQLAARNAKGDKGLEPTELPAAITPTAFTADQSILRFKQ
jgi:hypothetical protein